MPQLIYKSYIIVLPKDLRLNFLMLLIGSFFMNSCYGSLYKFKF